MTAPASPIELPQLPECATCTHWKPREEYQAGHAQGLGMCGAALMLWDCTEWRDDGDERTLKAAFKDHKAFVQDGSDYKAWLLTRPDFGCVQHAAIRKGE